MERSQTNQLENVVACVNRMKTAVKMAEMDLMDATMALSRHNAQSVEKIQDIYASIANVKLATMLPNHSHNIETARTIALKMASVGEEQQKTTEIMIKNLKFAQKRLVEVHRLASATYKLYSALVSHKTCVDTKHETQHDTTPKYVHVSSLLGIPMVTEEEE
jgi:hypothetical protein